MSKEISLSNGEVAIVDDCDFERINGMGGWKMLRGYAVKTIHYRKKDGSAASTSIAMHRVIMDAGPGVHVDHKNMIRSDNRRENLRLCSSTENNRNRKACKCNKFGYKGVSWHKRDKKYIAQIRIDNRKFMLGYFGSPEEAAHAYDVVAVKYHMDFAQTNNVIQYDYLSIQRIEEILNKVSKTLDTSIIK